MSKKTGINQDLERAIKAMLVQVSNDPELTLKDKLDIVNAGMKFEALKIKANEGAGFGGAFGNQGAETGGDDGEFE